VAANPREREPVPLAALVTRTLALIEPLADKRGVRLTFDGAEAVRVSGHAGLVQQVVLNLVMNAIQAMVRPGTVHLTLAEERATPPAGVDAAAGRYAHLCVEDAGKGIDPTILARVFEPFFTTKEVGEGTGLGLAVSYGIIREHGGWIEVESRVGVGSRFSVFLPTANEAQPRDEEGNHETPSISRPASSDHAPPAGLHPAGGG
jgi:signal transduction histidine kinase